MSKVGLDGAARDEQPLADLPVGEPSTVSRTTSLSVGVSESQPLSARRWAARLPRRSPHDADREINRWLGPLVVLMIFGFTSIAVVNTLAMIALRRRRELGLLGLVGATRRQVRSMARWARS